MALGLFSILQTSLLFYKIEIIEMFYLTNKQMIFVK